MQSNPKILGLILAGGAGRRVGGVDKGLVDYRGKPLVTHVLDALKPQVEKITISVNRNQEHYKALNEWVIKDKSDEHQGPIAGIVALIEELALNNESQKYEFVMIASCDVPNLPRNLVKQLFNACHSSATNVAVVHDGIRRQNLHCLIRVQALPSLLTFYQQGGRAMHRWFERNQIEEVDFSNSLESFKNLNSLEQIDAAEK